MRRAAEQERSAPNRRRPEWAAGIRTIWFLTAMIPVVILTALIGVLSLVIVSPLIVYAFVTGRHIKDPRRNRHGTTPAR